MPLLAVSMYSLENCLFRSPAHFVWGCLLFCFLVVWVLSVFWILCAQSLLCNPMTCSPPGSFVLGIFQARILEWVAISISSPLSDRQFANDFSLWWAAVSLCCWFPLLCRSFSLWCSPICLFLCLLLCFWCQIKRSVPRLVWSSYCLWILRLCS